MELIEAIFAVIITALTSFYATRKYYRRGKNVIRELAEALAEVSSAIEDDILTKEEMEHILKEFSDIIEAAKGKLDETKQ